MKFLILVMSNFYKFVFLIFKYFFNGILALIYIIFDIIKHFFYGIGTVFSILFKPLFNRPKKTQKEKLDDIKTKITKEQLEKAKIKAKEYEKQKNKESSKRKWHNVGIAKHKKNHAHNKKEVLLMNFEEDDLVKSDKKQTYIYEATDADGRYIKGKFDAFSKVDVHSFLLNEGCEVYSIKTSKWINFLYGSSSIASDKYQKKDLIFFLTQLSTYIKSGIPLIDSIRIFAKQEKKASKQKILQSIVYELVMGESFSSAIEKQGKAFPRLLVNMIKTAEMTGELPETLDDMADYYSTLEKTRKQMISAMMYPSIIFVMSVAIISFIMIWVIPQFVDIYKDLGTEMPAITQFVINTSAFLGKNYLYIFLGLAIFILIFIYLYKNIKVFRTVIQYIMMHVPVFGKIMIYSEITNFTKTFGSLLEHNVFITDSMEILSKITNNEIYKMIIYDTITNLAKGESISLSFKDHWAFPVVAYEMLLTGERTGELATMMNKVADFYQEQHSALVTQMKSFIEPIMIAFLAFVVGGILLAVIVPMFSMYSQI